MRQLACQGQFGWVVACLLILRLSFTAEIWMMIAVRDDACVPIGAPTQWAVGKNLGSGRGDAVFVER